jgi:ParB family chromosome partitioning protein
MATTSKITLSQSRDIPLNKLVLSQSNVRRVKAGVSIDELAESIARRTLLQSLTVRPVLDEGGAETGMFEVPAGGRRYRALQLLVQQKRLAKATPVPCVVREDGLAEEDSLAENIERAPLHPLDQFRAFQAMREKGKSEEDIAAAFFVSVGIVQQRLRLAAVSPVLLDLYADDGITLDQLMAFTVSPDHQRQEQVWEALQNAYSKQPFEIRRLLTESSVRASDRRAQYVGIDDYVEAGGSIMRDLFQPDEGGWLQDVSLLDRMVEEKLREDVAAIEAEGWKWVETAITFPYGHNYGLRRIPGEATPLSDEEEAARTALQAELDKYEAEYAEADELPDNIDQRLGEIETALAEFDDRPVQYDPDEVARAGAFVSIDGNGTLRIERGYVRPEDELPVAADGDDGANTPDKEAGGSPAGGAGQQPEPEDEGMKPLPDRLVTELTAHRTLALRVAVGERPEIAFLAALHALCLRIFYRYATDSCVELDIKHVALSAQGPELADSVSAQAFDARHQGFADMLPKESEALWDALAALDKDKADALFAHCVSVGINALVEPYNRRPGAIAHADRLADIVGLDLAAAGWRATGGTFLGRVTKARIVEAVRAAKGDGAAEGIAHLKKPEMVEQAEAQLEGSGWLPEPLRTLRSETDGVVEGEAPPDVDAVDGTIDGFDETFPDADDDMAIAAE